MRIASVNFYVFNRQAREDVRHLRRLGIDSIGFQEVQNHLHIVQSSLHNHRVLWNKRNNSYGAREVAVALRRNNRLLGKNGTEVSDLEPGEERKVFKSRWITVVRFKHEGKRVAHINYHGNAAIQDKRGRLYRTAERVREWLEAAVLIERRIKRLKKRGFEVVVTGDFNYRRRKVAGFTLTYRSPQRMFKRCGMEWIEHGVDYIAWTKGYRKTNVIKIDADEHGGDHPWLIVDLEER